MGWPIEAVENARRRPPTAIVHPKEARVPIAERITQGSICSKATDVETNVDGTARSEWGAVNRTDKPRADSERRSPWAASRGLMVELGADFIFVERVVV